LITNDQSNSVVALPVGSDGTLSKGTLTPTGGEGSNTIDGATNQPAAPDALVAQSSLTRVGNVSTSTSYDVCRVLINVRTSSLSMPVATPSQCCLWILGSRRHSR
jgi:hypothetical protein